MAASYASMAHRSTVGCSSSGFMKKQLSLQSFGTNHPLASSHTMSLESFSSCACSEFSYGFAFRDPPDLGFDLAGWDREYSIEAGIPRSAIVVGESTEVVSSILLPLLLPLVEEFPLLDLIAVFLPDGKDRARELDSPPTPEGPAVLSGPL